MLFANIDELSQWSEVSENISKSCKAPAKSKELGRQGRKKTSSDL